MLFIYLCVNECFVCVVYWVREGVCVSVHVCMKARDFLQISPFIFLQSILGDRSPTEPIAHSFFFFARLPDHQTPEICLSLPTHPQHWSHKHVPPHSNVAQMLGI